MHTQEEIDQIPIDQLRTYVSETLLPNHGSYYSPIGGGYAQYGEFEEADWGTGQAYYTLYQHHFNPETPQFSTNALVAEQPRMLEFQLQEVIKGSFGKNSEEFLRDLVARMEFSVGEFSAIQPEEIVKVLMMPTDQRRSSRLAEIYRTLYGERSLLYRTLIE